VHEEKDSLDWAERWARLEALVRPYRGRDPRTHDCIVPVSGGGDSHWIVHLVKERLGLNPLLVSYNRLYNTELGIRNLANLRIRFDCDLLQLNVNPESVKRIVRTTLRELGSLHWHAIAGQTVFPVQTAVRQRVPLIIWGAHQGLEQVGMFSHEHEVEMTRRHRKDHDLMGREADELLTLFDTLAERDIWQYRYPDDASLQAVGVRGIYLGNYVRWDPAAQHMAMARSHGYRGATSVRSFDTWDHVDCWNYLGLHDQLKLAKHGFSKVTDHASREIRHGRLTRAAALAWVRRCEQAEPPDVDLFAQWLGMDASGVRFVIDRWRSRRWWAPQPGGGWDFRGCSTLQPGADSAAAEPAPAPVRDFEAVDSRDCGAGRRYITVGKGWVPPAR
jgi:N-acetyl sugar amidotransferase